MIMEKLGWYKFAKKHVDPVDQIQNTYPGRYDGKLGQFVMSNKKLLFVEEKGWISKISSLLLEVPYEKVGEITVKGDRITFTAEDITHSITSSAASIIESILKDLIESYTP